MKKLISIALLLAMCLSLLAGCQEEQPQETTQAVNKLANAVTFIKNMYQDTSISKDEPMKLAKDKEVTAVVTVYGEQYAVTWSVEVTAGAAEDVAITEGSTAETVKIDINERPAEEVQFTLTATVEDAEGKKESVSLKYYIAAVEAPPTTNVLTVVENPVAGTAYKWGMFQGNLGADLYFAGTTANKDYYLSTTENADEAVDVTLEEVEGGYRIFFMADGTKTYIDIYQNGDYVNIRLTTEPTAVFTYNTEFKTFVADINGEPYYIGTYKEYNTLSASKLSYAATSFPSNMYAMESQTVTATVVDTPAVGTAYKWGMFQGNLGQELFFAGTTANKDYYLSTTENAAEATDMFLEEVEGGYRMYFMAGDVKTYVDIYQNGDYVNIRLTTEPTAVFVWNEEFKTMTTTVGEEAYYIGTYKEYNTLSASKLSYAATSFPSNLYVLG